MKGKAVQFESLHFINVERLAVKLTISVLTY